MGEHHPHSLQTCKSVAQRTDTVICALSGGVHSICAFLRLREHFPTVYPICQVYPSPDGTGTFEFLERYLDYLERKLKTRIYRIPWVLFWYNMGWGIYQPPHRQAALKAAEDKGLIPQYEYHQYNNLIKKRTGLEQAWVGTGIRKIDNFERRKIITKHGTVFPRTKHFYPIWDYSDRDVVQVLRQHDVHPSVEYTEGWYGRSFNGINARFTASLQREAPRDFAMLKFWFPLLELDIKRYKWRRALLDKKKGEPLSAERLEQLEKDLAEMVADMAAGFTAADAGKQPYDEVLDGSYWTAIAFQSTANRNAFFRAMGLEDLIGQYVSGEELAERLGIELPVPKMPIWKRWGNEILSLTQALLPLREKPEEENE